MSTSVEHHQQAHYQTQAEPLQQQTIVANQSNPGFAQGLAGFICSMLGAVTIFAIVGLVLSIVGLQQSKKANQSNGFAIAGIAISALWIVGGLIWFLIFFLSLFLNSTGTSSGRL